MPVELHKKLRNQVYMTTQILPLSPKIFAISSTQVPTNIMFFSEQYGCEFISDVLDSPSVGQVSPEKNTVMLDTKRAQWLKKALRKAASPIELSCVLPKISILILPEEIMHEYTGSSDSSGAYLGGAKTIILNEYLFQSKEKHFQQLINTLRNELSHASVEITHRQLGSNPIKDGFDALKPWRNDAQKKQLMEAYAAFKDRIARYATLENTPHKKLSHEERIELMRFRRALDSFKPTQLGPEGYNVMQVFNSINKEQKTVKTIKDIHSQPPSKGKLKQRRKYMATAFFRQENQISLHEAELSHNIYTTTGNTQYDQIKLWADKISDFDQLPPQMQRAFGSELCDYLQKFHQYPSYCDYPLSPLHSY